MSKKIVIDKEQIESLINQYETSDNPFYRGKLSQLKVILAHSTEIDTDQSIEERAMSIIDNKFTMYADESIDTDYDQILNVLKQIATEQDIISKAREKEKEGEKFTCTHCGSNKTYKTEAYHCNMCAMTTEI